MKPKQRRSYLAAIVTKLVLLTAFPAMAQDYAMVKSTIDGGGGKSAGGTLMVSGTLGQNDSAVVTGGSYQLCGGFWNPPPVIQVPPPILTWNADPNSSARGTRSLSISAAATTATGAAESSAIRVELIELQNPNPANPPCCPPPNFAAYESTTCAAVGEGSGCARWLGPNVSVRETQDNPGSETYLASRLQCTPYYADWTTLGSIIVVGAEIMPSSTYELKAYASSCKGTEVSCTNVSTPVQALTRRSGDITVPFAPNGTQPDSQDVVASVNKFRNLTGSLSKAVAQIQPNVLELNTDLGALDIVAVIDAFRGTAYPFSGPCPCPPTVTCNATPCGSASQCSGGLCIKTCSSGTNIDQPCLNDTHCPSSTCGTGFCRDRCGRCTP